MAAINDMNPAINLRDNVYVSNNDTKHHKKFIVKMNVN